MKNILKISKILLLLECVALIFLSALGVVIGLLVIYMGFEKIDIVFLIFGPVLVYSLVSGWATMSWSLSRGALKGQKLSLCWFVGCIVGALLPLLALLFFAIKPTFASKDHGFLVMYLLGFLFYISVIHIYIDYRFQMFVRRTFPGEQNSCK